jgi:hypothetical protein
MDKAYAISSRLPEKGYRDNPTVIALCAFADSVTSETSSQLESFHRELAPATAKPESLDYLAYLVGFSGRFWDTAWAPEVKRSLISLAHGYIWPNRGSLKVIKRLLEILAVPADLWQAGRLILSFKMPGTFGTGALRFYVRLPISIRKSDRAWREGERILENYAPAFTKHAVVYERFYLGFSQIGDPMFSK